MTNFVQVPTPLCTTHRGATMQVQISQGLNIHAIWTYCGEKGLLSWINLITGTIACSSSDQSMLNLKFVNGLYFLASVHWNRWICCSCFEIFFKSLAVDRFECAPLIAGTSLSLSNVFKVPSSDPCNCLLRFVASKRLIWSLSLLACSNVPYEGRN